MKLRIAICLLATAPFLFSCGGGGATGTGTTVDFKSDGTFLNGFEKKTVTAFMGGIVWNGKRTAQTIEIGISNADAIEIGPYGGFTSPKNDGEAIIAFKLSGPLFDNGTEVKTIKAGDVFTIDGTEEGFELGCFVYQPGNKMLAFNGGKYSSVADYEGTATITKLADGVVEGDLTYKTVDGTSSITVKFSEGYTDNWTGKGFGE